MSLTAFARRGSRRSDRRYACALQVPVLSLAERHDGMCAERVQHRRWGRRVSPAWARRNGHSEKDGEHECWHGPLYDGNKKKVAAWDECPTRRDERAMQAVEISAGWPSGTRDLAILFR